MVTGEAAANGSGGAGEPTAILVPEGTIPTATASGGVNAHTPIPPGMSTDGFYNLVDRTPPEARPPHVSDEIVQTFF